MLGLKKQDQQVVECFPAEMKGMLFFFCLFVCLFFEWESQHLLVLALESGCKQDNNAEMRLVCFFCKMWKWKVCDVILCSVVFGKSHQRQHVTEARAPQGMIDGDSGQLCFHHQWESVILSSAVSNWSRTELYSLVETRLNHILLLALQWLTHVWWHYKQDKRRTWCTRPYVHRE